MEFSVPAVQLASLRVASWRPVVQTWRVGAAAGGLEGPGLGMSEARFQCDSRPPACGGSAKKGGPEQALGRARGGLSTKWHLAVDAPGRPVELRVSPGQAHDVTQAGHLLAEHGPLI